MEEVGVMPRAQLTATEVTAPTVPQWGRATPGHPVTATQQDRAGRMGQKELTATPGHPLIATRWHPAARTPRGEPMVTPRCPPTATGPRWVRPTRSVRPTATRASPAAAMQQYQAEGTWRRAKPSRRPPTVTAPRRGVAPQRAPSMATSPTDPTTALSPVTRSLATTPFFILGSQRISPAHAGLGRPPPKA